MPGGDPNLNSVGRPGDVQARGASGWGPRSLVSLIRGFLFPSAPVDNAVIRADGVTGKLQGSTVIVTDAGATSGVTSLAMGGALSGVTTIANSGIQTNTNATDATSISDGSSLHAGGVSITKALWVGGLANIAGAATFQNNITQSGATTLSTGTGTNTLNGNVVVTTGKTITAVSGIIFSNETLSQYDTGTWTPVMSASTTPGSHTYALQGGYFIRVGEWVTCSCRLLVSAKDGTISGNIRITGLPFTALNAGSMIYSGAVSATDHVAFGDGIACSVVLNVSYVNISKLVSGTTAFATSVTSADLGAEPSFVLNITYQVA